MILRTPLSISIANGQSVSGWFWVGGHMLAGISLPAGFQGDTIKIRRAWGNADNSAADAATAQDVYDSAGNLVTAAAGADRFCALVADGIRGLGWVQLVALTAGAAQAQSADRTLKVALLAPY